MRRYVLSGLFSAALALAAFLTQATCRANELIDAIKAGDTPLVQSLLVSGADANEKTMYGGPLNIAAEVAPPGIVTILIDAGAKLETPGLAGYHPLHVAAIKGRADIVALLIERGAIVDALDAHGRTPLSVATISAGNVDAINALLAGGADPLLEDGSYHMTALHFAAAKGQVEVASVLLSAGVDINLRDGGGATALLHAAGDGQVDMVKFLVARGADVNIAGNDGETPYQVAPKGGQIQALLDNAGVKH